tara:strand:- start:3715 stop:3900 length:186 start_codon:yes stop_codon:yes gene_type:complete
MISKDMKNLLSSVDKRVMDVLHDIDTYQETLEKRDKRLDGLAAILEDAVEEGTAISGGDIK